MLFNIEKCGYNIADNLSNTDKMFRFFSKEADTEAIKYNLKENIIEGVEVFRTGVFRGTFFDETYLQALVDHFSMLKEMDNFRDVPVRVDHPDMFGLKNRMNSVVGYVARLYLKDTGKMINVKYSVLDEEKNEIVKEEIVKDVRLVTDMEITEPDAFEKIRRTTYRNRSIELGAFADNDGNTYEPTFMGVAWVDIPQVDKLNSLFSKDMKVEELNREDFEKEVEEKVEDKAVEKGAEDAEEVIEDIYPEKEEGKEETKENETVEDMKPNEKGAEAAEEEIKEEPKAEMETVSKAEYMQLQSKVKEFEMSERFAKLEVFVGQGKGTPALFELESKLVKSFFAVEGEEGYLNPLQQFELLLEMKASTPTMWEKKDGVVAVDDFNKKDEAKGEYKMSKASDEDVKEYAKKLVAEAGLNK